MSWLTTHVLDLAAGRPAGGIPITLERQVGSTWQVIGSGSTDADGRLKTLLAAGKPEAGAYRLTFDVERYFAAKDPGKTGAAGFLTRIPIQFQVAAGEPHYHVPLLLSPFGYSTYRGS